MSKRIPELDGLRAVAIMAVFLRHAMHIRMLWLGVDIFFVLSGFLITGILLDLPKASLAEFLGEFYGRRARRILAPYFLLLVVTALVFGTEWMQRWYLYAGLTNYVDYYYLDRTTWPLNPLWSLGVEEQFYLFWPLLVFLVKPARLPAVLIAAMIAAPLLRGLATDWADHQPWNVRMWFIYKSTPFRMDCLAAGCLLTYVWRRNREAIKRYGYLGLVVAALVPPLVIGLDRVYSGFSTLAGTVRGNVITLELSLVAATGIFLWALGGRYTAILRWQPVRFLGMISYSFYLIHEGAIAWCHWHLHSRFRIVIFSFTASVVYAALSWYGMERWLLRGGSRRLRRLEVGAAGG